MSSEDATVDPHVIEEARERLRQRMGVNTSRKGVSRNTALRTVQGNQNTLLQSGPVNCAEKIKARLKRVGMQRLDSVDKVVLHLDDNKAMIFKQPKVTVSQSSICAGLVGKFEISEGSAEMLNLLSKIKMMPQMASQFANLAPTQEKNDEEVPDLVEDFEAISEAVGQPAQSSAAD